MHHDFLPCWEALRGLILVQSIKNILMQVNPGTIGIVTLHHFLPEYDWEAEGCFLRPGDLRDLQIAFLALIEDSSAKQEVERDIALLQSIKVLRAYNLKVQIWHHALLSCHLSGS